MIEVKLIVYAESPEELVSLLEFQIIKQIKEGFTSGVRWDLEERTSDIDW